MTVLAHGLHAAQSVLRRIRRALPDGGFTPVQNGQLIPKTDRDLIATIGLFVVVTFGVALTLSNGTIGWGNVFQMYLVPYASITLIAFVPRCYYRAYRIIRSRGEISSFFQDPTILAWPVVPVVMVPLFFASFTVMKHLIAELGFTWDRAFTDLDHAIFGVDPWRLTHAVFGSPVGN